MSKRALTRRGRTGKSVAAFLLLVHAAAPAAVRSPAKKPVAATRATAPVVAGDPASWIPADAYPPEAIAAGAEGRVGFTLDVDPGGRVSGCRITSSSGTPVLDEATCQLVTFNARFRPAMDARRQPTSGQFASAVRWVLPKPAAAEPRGQ